MNPNSSRPKAAFTLIELISVIAIIALLSAVLIPSAGNALASARKSKMSSNMRQIALAHSAIHADNAHLNKTNNASSTHDWAVSLGEMSDLIDAQLWISTDDPQVRAKSGTLPKTIFDNTFRTFPLSLTIATNISPNAPPSTTPLLWTRGLQENGRWAGEETSSPGVYGSKGGFIAFLDGHVVWYDDLSKDGGQLIDYLTKQPTYNIRRAIGPRAQILEKPSIAFGSIKR